MIVRDEEEWIEPALDSALALGIDYWSIVDTGSLDKTCSIVREKLASVPGELIEVPWEGYASARSLALRRTHESDLAIMLDADMTIHGDLPDPTSSDSWLVEIHDDPWRYKLPLLTAAGPWYYKGAAHSFLHRDDRTWVERSSSLWVEDRRPGGWRPGKLQEDARALEAELELNPRDARSSFYLAQTYENLDRVGDALRQYGHRVLLEGSAQERFIAQLRRAKILCERDAGQGISACLEAWELRPSRAEPLYHAARRARRSEWNEVALVMARRAFEIERPADQLFVEEDVYRWAIALELGISELRAGDRERGELLLRELRQRDLPAAYLAWIDELLPEEVVV